VNSENSVAHYGELRSEKLAEENRIAREIVKEINNFGINERQRWLIMYLLSMELENVEDLKKVTSFIKENKGENIFLMTNEEVKNG
jgi:hypothetical protein